MTIQCSEKMNSVKTSMTGKKQRLSALDIQAMVSLAAKSIAPVWPLKTFIACNSLQGFESQPFDKALTEAQYLFEQNHLDYRNINRETIKWCGTYFDEGQSVIEMPSREKGFYFAFKELSKYDQMLHQGSKKNQQWLRTLPDHAESAIIQCLDVLQVSEKEHISFLKKSLAQLPGWSGYIKWQTEWKNSVEPSDKPSNVLIDFMAIR
ncbi:MAG: Na-translocating system protein MpsB, partial [Legionellaceae bacterium]|nr:Na-translocating system protein MpsB [Legionellaceae bacterium]